MRRVLFACVACIAGLAFAAPSGTAQEEGASPAWTPSRPSAPPPGRSQPSAPATEPWQYQAPARGGAPPPSRGVAEPPDEPPAPRPPAYQSPGGSQSPSQPPPSTPSTPAVRYPGGSQPPSRLSPSTPVGPPGQRPPVVVTPPPPPAPPPAPYYTPPSWPIKRRPNTVRVRPFDDRHHRDRRHGRPLLYMPLVFFGGVLVDDYYDRYDRDRWRDYLRWEDSAWLEGEEGWVEFTLDSGAAGERLWIEIRDGRAQIDWAEIVFDDGLSQVVDFNERSFGPGIYRFLEFRYTRGVAYVRMVARATTNRVQIILRLER